MILNSNKKVLKDLNGIFNIIKGGNSLFERLGVDEEKLKQTPISWWKIMERQADSIQKLTYNLGPRQGQFMRPLELESLPTSEHGMSEPCTYQEY